MAILAALPVALFFVFREGEGIAPAPASAAFKEQAEAPPPLLEVEEGRRELLREEIVDVHPLPQVGGNGRSRTVTS